MELKLTCTATLAILGSAMVGCRETEPVDWIEVPLAEHTYFAGTSPYREDSYEILVLRQSAIEFKLGQNGGDAITYNWELTTGDPELLHVEFHGHTHRVGDAPGTVMFYKIHSDGKENGTLVAPFDGIHGWYLDNQSTEDMMITLRVSGSYFDAD